jgi:hypothetical protein
MCFSQTQRIIIIQIIILRLQLWLPITKNTPKILFNSARVVESGQTLTRYMPFRDLLVLWVPTQSTILSITFTFVKSLRMELLWLNLMSTLSDNGGLGRTKLYPCMPLTSFI